MEKVASLVVKAFNLENQNDSTKPVEVPSFDNLSSK